jgi:HlyD family secretion protein
MGMDKNIEKKKGIRLKHLWIGIAVLLVLGMILMSIFSSQLSVYRVEREKVTISLVSHDVFNDYISLNGTVEPISTIYVNSKERGTIEEKLVENGVMVNKGDALLRLSNSELLLEIQNAEATFAEQLNSYNKQLVDINKRKIELTQQRMTSDLDVKQMKREYGQKEVMYKDGMGTKEDYLRAKENYEMQLSRNHFLVESQKQDSIYQITQLKQLKESMEINKLNLNEKQKRKDKLMVRATISGQLGGFDAELGQTLSANQSVGIISVLTDHKITANVDEHYIDRVRENLTGKIERQDDYYQLHIRRVYPEVKGGQFKIDLVFDGAKPENIRTGQTYQIKLELGESEQAILLSKGGFFQSTGGQWVYVLNENETDAEKRSIRIGKQNPRYYEVLEGLKAGEKVITSSYDLFGDNDKIVFK